MSEIIITVPDAGWYASGCNTKPVDKQLCIVLFATGKRVPKIMQYRKADWLWKDRDYFLDVSEKWEMDANGYPPEEWNPSFADWGIIDRWKPLGLPKRETDRLVAQIESWFEEC